MLSLQMTANTFGIAQNTVSCIVFEVCNAITIHMGPKYLRLPDDEKPNMEWYKHLDV